MEGREMGLEEQLMIRFGGLERKRFANIGGSGLRHGERAVLFHLKFAENPSVRASEIAGELNMTAPNVTPILNRLEEMGYIRREIEQRDRRAVRTMLTEQGHAALERDIAQMREFFAGLAGYLGERDCVELLRLLDKTLEYYTQNQQ